MKDTELYREMARNLQHELSKEQERLEDRAKELNERMQLVDMATQLMDDNEKMSEENASLQRQLAEERQRRVELEMKLNEMNKLTAEVGKKANDEVLLKMIQTYVNSSKRKRAEKRAAIKEWALRPQRGHPQRGEDILCLQHPVHRLLHGVRTTITLTLTLTLTITLTLTLTLTLTDGHKKKRLASGDGNLFFLSLCERDLLNVLFNLVQESLGRFESGNVVSGNNNRGVLADVAASLFSATLDNEAAETSQINVFTTNHGILNGDHEFFNNGQNSHFFDTSLLGNRSYDFCFCHFTNVLKNLKIIIDCFIPFSFDKELQKYIKKLN